MSSVVTAAIVGVIWLAGSCLWLAFVDVGTTAKTWHGDRLVRLASGLCWPLLLPMLLALAVRSALAHHNAQQPAHNSQRGPIQ